MKKRPLITAAVMLIVVLLIVLILPIPLPVIPPGDEPLLPVYKETGNGFRVVSNEIPVSEQLRTLYRLGFVPRDEMKDLFEARLTEDGWPEHVIEMYPYWLAFTALGWGHPAEDGEAVPYSDTTYCFSTWNNLTPESYAHTLSQIERLSDGEIPLKNVKSGRTSIVKRLWVSYELADVAYKWTIPDDIFRNPHQIYNPNIIDIISKYSASDEYGRDLFWMHDEQGFHLVYATEQSLMNLRDVTGINFFGPDDNQMW